MSRLGFQCFCVNPMDQVTQAVKKHKEAYDGVYPLHVTLSADWKESMQQVTTLVVEGHEIVISYRKNQHRDTVSCGTTIRGNRRAALEV